MLLTSPRRPRGLIRAVVPALLATLGYLLSAAEAAAEGPVIGSRGSMIYHEPSCGSATRLKPENRIPIPSLAIAEANGFRACRTCTPNEAIAAAASVAVAAVPAAAQEPEEMAEEGPTFSTDVAPVLVANCVGCHNAERLRGDFDMTSFRKLMAGSEAGAVIEPGKPAESELVRRIKGQSTPAMPPNDNNLADETIATIEAWIAGGALLDPGADPNAPLADVAVSADELRRAELAAMAPEERHALLAEAAGRRWSRAGADGSPAMTAGEHFVLFGDLPEDRTKRVLATLEKAYASLRGLLSRPEKPALEVPPEISIYVFDDRNHYAEFVRSVANQEPDAGEHARADLGADPPYVVALDASTASADGRGLEAMLVEPLAAEAVAAAGPSAPRWLALGLGAYMAAKLGPQSPYVARLRGEVVRAYQLGWTTKAGEALGDQLPADETKALGYSLLDWLTTANRRAFPPFVRGMLGGKDKLDDGIQILFGADRQQFLVAWGRFVASQYARRR